MEKTLQLIQRAVLVLGVLIALSPCYACDQNSSKMSSCSMHDTGSPMSCCHHSKPMNPLCKVMNQSAVSPSPVHAVTAATPLMAVKVFQPFPTLAMTASPVAQVVESPPRSSSILRI